MTTKKTTTTKTVTEKEVKTPATEAQQAATSTKATAASAKTTKTAKASTKKMTKEELVEKAMAFAKAKKEAKKPVEEKDISAEKEQELFDEVEKPKTAKKPVKKVAMTKKVQTKAKTPVFPEILKIENLGTLKKVTSEDYQELKAMENLAFVTVWNKKSVKCYDDNTPGVKTSDLYTIGNWSYDVSTPIFFKENSEQVVTISNFTEACFIFGHANCFDILEDENGEGNFRNDYDLVFEIYQVVETEEQ